MLAVAIALALTQGSDSLYARAESLLVAGALPSARRIAERLERERPDDPRALILLGRVHLAWPVIGRWAADSLFTRALAIDPENREAHYYGAKVGLALGGDDGESRARRHLEHLLALDPDYHDTWADLRRAGLLVELRAWTATADAAAGAIAARSSCPTTPTADRASRVCSSPPATSRRTATLSRRPRPTVCASRTTSRCASAPSSMG